LLVTMFGKIGIKREKNEFVKLCIQLLKDETKSPVFDKSGKVSSIITNINALIDKGLKGQLKVEAVVSTLQELVTLHPDIPSIILDVLSITDASCIPDNSNEDSKERSNLCYIIKECEKVYKNLVKNCWLLSSKFVAPF
jgi:THO complex subunit 2